MVDAVVSAQGKAAGRIGILFCAARSLPTELALHADLVGLRRSKSIEEQL